MRVLYLPSTFQATGMYRLIFPFRELDGVDGFHASTPPYECVETVSGPDGGEFQLFQYKFDRFPLDWDVYVIQMPLDKDMLFLVKVLRKRGALVLGECDDSDRLPLWHPAREGTDPQLHPERNREWRRRVFQACHAVTVSTERLADELAPWQRETYVLPNYLLLEMWEGVAPQYGVEREHGRVRVGWMGVSHWRSGDLDVLRPVIRPFLERNPHVDFVAAGDGRVHDLLGVPEDRRVTLPQVRFPVGLRDLTATMDVGLVPLDQSSDEACWFNDCKSNLKGLEYGVCGIPCVASPSAPYREWLQDGEGGLLAGGPEGWGAHLDALVRDDGLRRLHGAAARRKALASGIKEHAYRWLDLYEDLLERHRKRQKPSMAMLSAAR